MKGFSSLVLVSIALLQTAAAAPIVLERSQVAVEGGQNVEKRGSFTFGYLQCDEVEGTPETETQDVEKRGTN
ncbi:hypothetical protein BDR03DRAFT_973538 [Suillus americanus]|nr:hypothetical protein BDR03DRAFT_973538 [Suillus americanus]